MRTTSVPCNWAGPLGLAYVVLGIASRLSDPFWLFSLLTFLPLLPVRAAVAAINARVAPTADTNSRFSGANIVLVVVGGLLLALSAVGMFLPEELVSP